MQADNARCLRMAQSVGSLRRCHTSGVGGEGDMPTVVTLTMNPAIDLSVSVERVTPFLLPWIVTIGKISTILQ